MQLLSSSISHILRVWGEGAHPDDGIPNMRLLPPPRSPPPPPVRLYSQSRLAMLPPPRTPRPKKPAKKPTYKKIKKEKKLQLLRRNRHGYSCRGAGWVSAVPVPLSSCSHHCLVGIGTQSPGTGCWLRGVLGSCSQDLSPRCSRVIPAPGCGVWSPSCHCCLVVPAGSGGTLRMRRESST